MNDDDDDEDDDATTATTQFARKHDDDDYDTASVNAGGWVLCGMRKEDRYWKVVLRCCVFHSIPQIHTQTQPLCSYVYFINNLVECNPISLQF